MKGRRLSRYLRHECRRLLVTLAGMHTRSDCLPHVRTIARHLVDYAGVDPAITPRSLREPKEPK